MKVFCRKITNPGSQEVVLEEDNRVVGDPVGMGVVVQQRTMLVLLHFVGYTSRSDERRREPVDMDQALCIASNNDWGGLRIS